MSFFVFIFLLQSSVVLGLPRTPAILRPPGAATKRERPDRLGPTRWTRPVLRSPVLTCLDSWGLNTGWSYVVLVLFRTHKERPIELIGFVLFATRSFWPQGCLSEVFSSSFTHFVFSKSLHWQTTLARIPWARYPQTWDCHQAKPPRTLVAWRSNFQSRCQSNS